MEQGKWFKDSATFAEEIKSWKWWFVVSIIFIVLGVLLRALRQNAVS
jgi:hypothetical protein